MNVCEHGDHPAPAGQRFCSEACQRCEAESVNGCDGLCGAARASGREETECDPERRGWPVLECAGTYPNPEGP